LKLVVMSATLDALKFQQYFDNAPLMKVLQSLFKFYATFSVVLCCAVLCCAVLCCAVLCCAVLCCAVLCCAVLCCAVLCCALLCFTMLYYALLCCTMLYYAVLCCTLTRAHTIVPHESHYRNHGSRFLEGLIPLRSFTPLSLKGTTWKPQCALPCRSISARQR
jgi:hypothetical protein